MDPQVKAAQQVLFGLGLDPKGIDGVFGPNTRARVRAFQAIAGLPVSGVITLETQKRLETAAANYGLTTGGPAIPDPVRSPLPSALSLPWIIEAKRYIDLKEGPGKSNNKIILGWAEDIGGWVADFYIGDDIPWCGLFIAMCVRNALPDEPLPNNPLGAGQYVKFGRKLEKPVYGALGVFKRPGGHHTGWIVGEDSGVFRVLGGNQSDSVRISLVSKDRLLTDGIRWPSTAPTMPNLNLVKGESGTYTLSHNEA